MLYTNWFKEFTVRNIKKYFPKWILPILFIGYYSCISFCAHIHIENGVVILHSHFSPHGKNQIPHQHNSMEEIILFHTLSTLQAVDGAVQAIVIERLFSSSFTVIATEYSLDLFSSIYKASTPRAPPAFLI